MSQGWRLINDLPLSGEDNMAIDRQLYRQFKAGDSPSLRFYQWSEPTVSFGRLQKPPKAFLDRLIRYQIPWVKRPTGGQAILHSGDLCIGIVGGPSAGFKPSILETHAILGQAFISGLTSLGVSAQLGNMNGKSKPLTHCFEQVTQADIHIAGQKLLGGAQIRSRSAFLQESVIYLNCDQALMCRLFQSVGTSYRDLISFFPDLDAPTLKKALIHGFETVFKMKFQPEVSSMGVLR